MTTFEVLTPHRELAVTATSVVDVRPLPSATGQGIGWDELARRILRSISLAECAAQSPATEPDEEMVQLAARIRTEGGGIDETALAICTEVGGAMEYRKGVTGVNSTARDAWPTRSGVCQDIAHVALGVLRAAGIPARYVSGYLHPNPEAAVGESVDGESHAWVEWYSGQWHGYDPTNLVGIGESHVYVGHGREYADVAPLRGVYAGSGSSELFVSVELTRLS